MNHETGETDLQEHNGLISEVEKINGGNSNNRLHQGSSELPCHARGSELR